MGSAEPQLHRVHGLRRHHHRHEYRYEKLGHDTDAGIDINITSTLLSVSDADRRAADTENVLPLMCPHCFSNTLQDHFRIAMGISDGYLST